MHYTLRTDSNIISSLKDEHGQLTRSYGQDQDFLVIHCKNLLNSLATYTITELENL